MRIEDFVAHHGVIKKLDKGSHVFRQGDEDRSLYFVQEGLLKAYYLDADGRESVKSFIQKEDVICSLASAHSKQTCSFSLSCLTEVTLCILSFDAMLETSKEDQELSSALLELVLDFAIKKERREFEFLCLSAEERYRLLCDRSPDLVIQITQNEIARYLGITPVALSRIRGRIARRH